MSNDTPVTVHFSCPHCLTVYRATQERTAEKCAGEFYCGSCHAGPWMDRVLRFLNWNPVTKSMPIGRRVW